MSKQNILFLGIAKTWCWCSRLNILVYGCFVKGKRRSHRLPSNKFSSRSVYYVSSHHQPYARKEKWKRRWHKFAVCVNLCYTCARVWRTNHCILHLTPQIILNAQTHTNFLSACIYAARVSSPPNGFHARNIYLVSRGLRNATKLGAAARVCVDFWLRGAPGRLLLQIFCLWWNMNYTHIHNVPTKNVNYILFKMKNKYQNLRNDRQQPHRSVCTARKWLVFFLHVA